MTTATTPFREWFVDVGGTPVRYLAGGSGEPVVLVHGWPLHCWSFRHLIRALAEDGRRVLAPDLRGFGSRPLPKEPFSHVDDLLELLDGERVQVRLADRGACGIGARVKFGLDL